MIPVVQATESKGGIEAGLLMGAGLVNGVSSFAYGLTGHYHLNSHVAVGLRYSNIGLGVPPGILSGYTASSSVSTLMAEGKYTFTEWITGTFLVARLGLMLSNSSLSGALLSLTGATTNFAYGLACGYQFTLSSQFTLSPGLDFTWDPTASITLINIGARLGFKF